MEHRVIHKSNTSQLSTSYSTNILVITLTVFSNLKHCNQIYQIQLYNNHLPMWIDKNLGSVEKLYQILEDKKKYQVSQKIGIIRFYLQQESEDDQLKGAYLLKLNLKEPANEKQQNKQDNSGSISNLNDNINPQISKISQKCPARRDEKQYKPEQMIDETHNQNIITSDFVVEDKNSKENGKEIIQGTKQKQKRAVPQIIQPELKQNNNNIKQQDKLNNSQNKMKDQTYDAKFLERMKILEDLNKAKHEQQSNQMLQISGRMLRSRKVAEQKPQPILSYSNYLKSQQKRYASKSQKQSQLVKNLKRENKESRQQVLRLHTQIEHMNKVIKQLNTIVDLQKIQIEEQRIKMEQMSEYISRNQQQSQSARSMSHSQRKQPVYKEWIINKRSKHFQHFQISGMKITHVGKGDSWSYLFLQNIVSKRHQFNLTIYVSRCVQKNIAFGIAFHKRANEDACWNQRQCIQYVGFSKMVWEGGRMKTMSGMGIWEDVEIRLSVNIADGSVKWYSQRGVQAEHLSRNLRKSRYSYVPFLRFKNFGDSVQILGIP